MPRLGKRAARAAIIALEIAGVFLAAGAGLAGFLYWRLQAGPVSLAVFKESADFAIEHALPPGHEAKIAKARLARGQRNGDYDLILDDVTITGPSGKSSVHLPQIVAIFSLNDLFHGAFGPYEIFAADAALRIERGPRGGASNGPAPTAGRRPDIFRTLIGGKYFREAFKSAQVVRTQIYFTDAESGRAWRADGSQGIIRRTPEGYAARFEGVIDVEDRRAPFSLDASYAEASELISANMHFADAPIGDLVSAFFGHDDAILSAPLTADASIVMEQSGKILSSALKGRAGPGTLRIRDTDADVAFIEFAAAFDPERNRFDLQQFEYEIGGSSGAFTGEIDVRRDERAIAIASVAFKLDGENIVLDTPEFFPAPLSVARLEAEGGYDSKTRRLSLASLRSELLGVTLSGAVSCAWPETTNGKNQSSEFKANLKVDGALDTRRLLLAWPVHVADGARDFVAERMPRGEAKNIVIHVDLPAGALVEGQPTPDKAIDVRFDIVDATAIYTPGMTPVTGASGSARLTGNRFFIDGARGRIGDVALTEGEIEFTALAPRGEPVHFRFTANGAASDILGVLNEKPLEVLKPTNLDPARFTGDASVRVDVMRPNRREVARETYGYAGKAAFENIDISEFYRGIDITSASGEIDLASRSMIVTASAGFGGAPIDFEWRQKFYAVDGRSEFRLSGVVDSSTGDVFGVPTRELLRGPVAFEARASGDLAALDAVSIDADFTGAALSLDAFGWMKPQGAPAKGSLSLAFGGDGVEVNAATLIGDGVDIQGVANLGPRAAIQSASFERFFLEGGADFTVVAARSESGPLELQMTGPFLNVAPFFEAVVNGPSGEEEREAFDWGEGVILRARIDNLALRAGAQYRDASLDFRRGPAKLEALQLSARTAAGSPISMALIDTGADSGPAQTIEARTDDIGALMAGVFGVTSIKGGEGSMRIQINPVVAGASQDLAGLVEARGLRVVGAPLLTRIFSAGSLTGLNDLLNGDGIEISAGSAEFGFRKGLFTLKEARASGPSVGLTASGSIAAGGRGGVNLNGAIAPMYQVNSILGRTPVIGELFVGREGEGVVALAYQVTGPVDAPTVAVNPLSALAPGFLRRMFDPARDEADNAEKGDDAPPSRN